MHGYDDGYVYMDALTQRMNIERFNKKKTFTVAGTIMLTKRKIVFWIYYYISQYKIQVVRGGGNFSNYAIV